MNKMFVFALFVGMLLTLTACSAVSKVNIAPTDKQVQFTMPGANPELDKPVDKGHVAGFATGLWHGLISLVTLFVSFFNPAIQMYEVHNNGPLYNLGFLIGAILLFAILGFLGGRRR